MKDEKISLKEYCIKNGVGSSVSKNMLFKLCNKKVLLTRDAWNKIYDTVTIECAKSISSQMETK